MSLLAMKPINCTRASFAARGHAATPAPLRRNVAAQSHAQLLSTIAAAGDVDAPISVVVGAAVVVSLAATALIPLVLNPGQEAANKIFAVTEKKPIDKKPAAGKKGKE
ncbi:hypothetical protein GPECTOR_3g301 [Gonium pectorale]|uniref:Uncharacterized protein n=1 Tax=Gonium pectorale TaxID=33097 RepID=A0A150GZG9_GONPE|nr:hypothetical protein GPECTOR_3g301 [Gonium pectorale]|eukprot:KXZ55153.1 hypothetical protein GPECTOR_3g301 [Gonium pectorale]